MNRAQRLIFNAVAASAARPWLVFLLLLALTGVSGWYASTHFEMSTDTKELISEDTGWRRDEVTIDNAFPQLIESMIIVVDGETPELVESAAARLAARLAQDKAHFRTVKRADGGGWFARQGILFGSVDEVRKTTQGLIEAQPLLGPLAADPSLRGIAGALGTVLTGVENGATSLAAINRPMTALDRAVTRKLDGERAFFSWQTLFTQRGGPSPPTRQIILTRPVLDYNSLKPGETAMARVHTVAREMGLDAAHGIRVQMTGEVPLNDQDFATLEENIGLVGGVMVLAMLITLWFATRSVKLTAAIIVTTLAGLIITTALGLLVVGRFNLISVAFIPLFVGLGVDFGIQLSVRFNHERAMGQRVIEALEEAACALGAPLALAAGAIFLGFAAFLPTDYVGISELGVIAGMGMIVALLLAVTLLPVLIVLLHPNRPRREVGFSWAAPVDHWLARHRRAVLWAFALSMLGSIALLPLVNFDFNPLHLRDRDAPAMRALADLMRDPTRTPNTIYVIARNPVDADLWARRAAALPEVAQAVSLDSFVPADQPAKLAMVQDAALLLDVSLNPFDLQPAPSDAETVAALRETAARLRRAASGSDPAAARGRSVAATLDRLAAAPPAMRAQVAEMLVTPLGVMLDQTRTALQAQEVSRDSIPPEIREDWVAPDGRERVQIFPAGDSNDNAVLARFVDAVRHIAPHLTGLPVSTQEAAKTVAHAFIIAGVIALVLVSLLLWLVLRDMREVAFTLAPVVLSGFLTLGSCVLIGQSLNFANIIAFPLLFGVGVAFHIYFVMAWRDGERDLLQSSLARAVLFSALATGTAFGALWLSAHPGTASMGKILMISLAWTLVCALIFEPALLGPPAKAGDAR